MLKTSRNPARKALLSSGKRNVGRRSRWKERFAAANMGFLLLNVIFTINFIYTMKKLIILLFCLLCTISMLRAADTIFVRAPQVPVLIGHP